MLRVEAWQRIEEVIRGVMRRFAFEEIRTPVLEKTELITRSIGALTDIVHKEMFSFRRGKTDYVLRPELTAPVMRAYLQHHMGSRGGVRRLFYMGACFRAERPQKGRFRQFHQFGAEIIGTDDARADAEIIGLLAAVYDAFGIDDVSLRVNTLGDPGARPRYVEALRRYLEPLESELSDTSKERLRSNPLRILDTKSVREKELLAGAPRLIDFVGQRSIEFWSRVKGYLDDLEITYTEDPFLVRGLDYYTHTAFELESPHIGAQSALAGGGRYDLLAREIGGKSDVPSVGFAAGIERLFLALEAQEAILPGTQPLDVFLVAQGQEAMRRVLRLGMDLRVAGLRASFDLDGRSMKAQMRAAHRARARHVIIVGEEELDRGCVQVKDMETGDQFGLSFDSLAAYFLGV